MNEFRDNVFLGSSGHDIQLTGDGLLTNEIRDNWFYVSFTWRQRIIVWLHWLLLAALLLSLSACASQAYPITSGSHVPNPPPGRFVVWSNHPGVEAYLMSLLLELKQPVVERSRVTKVFDEQKFRLRHTDDDVLRIGKLVGATQVLFADVSGTTPSVFRWTEPPPKQSVTLRAVDVQSGQVLWVGSARYLESMAVPDQAVVALTYWALAHALCDGTWDDPTSWNKGGCVSGHAQKTVQVVETEKPEPTIWREMRGMER